MDNHDVSSAGQLLLNMVRALLYEARPDVEFQVACVGRANGGGVRVTHPETGRWLAILPAGASAGVQERGCVACLTTGSTAREFQAALELLAAGRIGTTRQETEPARLTGREREVLQLVAAGLSNGEIAGRLTISLNTVRSHLRALHHKLEACNRTRIVANAQRLGFAEASGFTPWPGGDR